MRFQNIFWYRISFVENDKDCETSEFKENIQGPDAAMLPSHLSTTSHRRHIQAPSLVLICLLTKLQRIIGFLQDVRHGQRWHN